MAPGFFSKLVKGTPTNAGSNNNNTSSKGSSFESTYPSSGGRTSTQTSPAPSSLHNKEFLTARNKNNGTNTPDSLSTKGSVTIGIIPPSPRTINSDIPHHDPRPESHMRNDLSNHKRARSQDRQIPDRHAISLAARPASSSGSTSEDALPTPTPSHPHRLGEWDTGSTKSSRSQTRQLTPASSTGNLRGFVEGSRDSRTPPPLPFGVDNPRPRADTYVERRTSNRSIRSQTQVPSPLVIKKPHSTVVAENGQDSEAQRRQAKHAKAGSVDKGSKIIIDSPTAYSSQGELLNPHGDTDARSVRSATSSKKKKSWRRPSLSTPTRKPTGLASAIAASGIAMANPGSQVPGLPHTPHSGSKIALAMSSGSKSGDKQSTKAASASVPSVPSSLDVRSARSRQLSLSKSDNSDQYLSDVIGSSDDSSASDDELDMNEDDIPVTGFAVASSKRNADFHELFPSIPEGDYLIEDYGCALQREILIQGRLYISENHICFHANIFGWITDLSIPIYEIISLEKKMTAFVIPNAIQIATRRAKYTFASFLSRDTTYDVIANIWRLAKPEIESLDGMGGSRSDSSQNVAGAVEDSDGSLPMASIVVPRKKATQCACGKDGSHLNETALETVLPGTPDKIYNLMFTSGFIKDFMRVEQKLADIQISDWSPTAGDSKLLCRNMSYIKPLNNSVGPKQTKCELRDETVYCDFDDYVVTVTTTRTPDVPSGGVFAVKTRTCMMWASAITTRVVVTTQVDWTGRSFIKGLIEKSAIEGQKVYHADLDKAMRMYIQEHQSEFVPAGVDPSAVAPVEALSPSLEKSLDGGLVGGAPVSDELARKTREQERNQRGLQWAYDTFDGAYGVAKRSAGGAIELIKDAWDQSSSTTILYFVIVLLVLSNIWTLLMVGRREEVGRQKELRKLDDREKWVQGIVTGLWEELDAGRPRIVSPLSSGPVGSNLREEVASIGKMLDGVEERVQRIRESLNALD